MDYIKLTWFTVTDKAHSLFFNKYCLVSVTFLALLYTKKPTFTRQILKLPIYFILSPFIQIASIISGSPLSLYYLLTRNVWFRVKRAWMEIEVGQKIPTHLNIFSLDYKEKSLLEIVNKSTNNNKYVCLIFGSCT